MANEKIIEVISRINAHQGFSYEIKSKAIAEILASPDRADSILEVMLDLEAEQADMGAYCDGNGIEENRQRELARREAEAAVARQEKVLDEKIRRAAVFNIMGSSKAPVYGTPEFDAAFQAEYTKLKNGGGRIVFDPAGGAFVYDMEKNNLTDRQLELINEQERKAQTSDEVIGKTIKVLPDGEYTFRIVGNSEKVTNGLLRQTLRLEEVKSGFNAWISWIIDKNVDASDWKKTRRYNLSRYSDENCDCFAGMTEEQAMELLMRQGIKAWAYTYANAKTTEDGKKFCKLFLTEADFNYVVRKESAKAVYAEERAQRERETKSETWKF